MFDSASERALRDWKFKPRVVNGEPISVENIKQKFSFELGD